MDFPEVIDVRRRLLPEPPREKLVPGLLTGSAWMDTVAGARRPVIFIAEGVMPYLSRSETRALLLGLARRFPGAELSCDVLNRFSAWFHQFHPGIRRTGAKLDWGVDSAAELAAWATGSTVLEEWNYFEQREPRLKAYNWMRWLPLFGKANFLVHLRLGEHSSGPADPPHHL